MYVVDGLKLALPPLFLSSLLSRSALGQNQCTGTGTRFNAPSAGECQDSWVDVGGEFIYPDHFDVLNEVTIYTCPQSQRRIIISNGIPDHTVESRRNARPCEAKWAVSLPLNPTDSSGPIEIPARGIIAMATNGVPAYGALEAGDNNAVEPDGDIQDAQFWYGHATSQGVWHFHNPYMGADVADHTTLLGWALDGYAIYGPYESDAPELDELDACNGREVEGAYQYHVRKREQVDQTLEYCKSDTNPETNWNYILGCYHGTTANTIVSDSTLDPTDDNFLEIPSDCVVDGSPTAAPTEDSSDPPNPSPVDNRPNIIVMQPDDMAFFEDWTPPPNNPNRPNKYNYFPETNGMPHMDSLRLNGAEMMQAYTTSPACGTSRYSTITGKYPSRAASSRDDDVEGIAEVTIPKTKLMDVGDEKDCTRDNIAVALRNAGYRTGMVGKWHLSRINDSDYSYTHAVDIVKGCGFDFVDALYIENMAADPDDFDNYSDGTFSHNMEFVTHEAVKFIKEGDGPFFLYVNPTVPHSSQAVDVALNNFTCQDTPRGTDTSDFMIPGMTEEFGSCEAYRANVTARADTTEDLGSIWLDDSVGAILQALNDKDVLDNTMIIFQQDHGVETKMALYENGNRIAQFVHFPDVIQPGTKYYIPVSTIDIAATLLDFAEVEESPYAMDGKSWKSDILESENDSDRCLFFEMEKDRAVRCGCDKYLTIYEQDSGTSTTYQRGIQYDLSADLTNLFDLCGDTDSYITDSGDNQESEDLNLVDDFPEIAEDMAKVLQCHLDRTSHSADPGNITRCDLNPLTDSPTSAPLTDSPTSAPLTYSPTNSGCKLLQIELNLDSYGSETSWEVADPDDIIVAQGGGYADITQGEYVVYDYCLLPGCDYTFTIFDSIGDGMCCGYGEGSYTVTYDGEVVASGGNFGSSESTNFGCPCENALLPIEVDGNQISCELIDSLDKCDVEAAKFHCPKLCNACSDYGCEDSIAPLNVLGNIVTCTDIKNFLGEEALAEKCDESEILAFTCRKSCKICEY